LDGGGAEGDAVAVFGGDGAEGGGGVFAVLLGVAGGVVGVEEERTRFVVFRGPVLGVFDGVEVAGAVDANAAGEGGV
jgi:hypothetical protein